MNVKLISKALHTLSLLSEEDVQLVLQFRALTEDERQMLMLVLEPQKRPTITATPRKIEHCDADGCGLTRRARVHKDATADGYHGFQLSEGKVKKSRRASSLEGVIQRTPKVKTSNDDDIEDLCSWESSDGPCFRSVDDNVHHKQTDLDYHPFQPPASTAERSSSANGGGVSGTANTETGVGAAGAVAGGSSD